MTTLQNTETKAIASFSCSVEGCDRKYRCSGYCGMHYSRLRNHGDPGPVDPIGTRGDRPNRPKTDTEAWCTACEQMLPHGDFSPRASQCRSCISLLTAARRPRCADCGAPVGQNAKRCTGCYGLTKRGVPHKTGRYISKGGYVRLSGQYDHPNANSRGVMMEHTKVMSEMLGRPLRKGENVHHKNGVRHDNRPENLELWVISQPAGQRPADLVVWAKEILERYDK